ncbi:hypothetical protein L484_001490 [Morus notabilis]|uniref:Uncharacterized protein n=1 Tax=Morus notabilis TaxID=981085 RepID=W9SET9_9ROSA|nr:hypothetical protein L484_001490 [Morus notabilis]
MPPAASRKLDKMEIDLTNLLNKVQHFEANQAAMKEDLKEIKAMVVNSVDIMKTIQKDVLLFLKQIQNNPLTDSEEDREKELSAELGEHEGEFGYTQLIDSFDISQQALDRTFEEAEKIIAMRKVAAQGIKKEQDYEETENEEEEKSMKRNKRKSAKEQREKMEELGIHSFILFTQSSNDLDS